MDFKNCIIYLIGLPGVGKRTIGGEICAQADFRLIHNHLFNNVVFPFVRVDGETTMPPEIWDACDSVRHIALKTLVDVGNRDFNYVFTNMLLEEDPEDVRIYNDIESTAVRIGATFLPVRLMCGVEENKRRIVTEDRDRHHKTTNPDLVDRMGAGGGALEFDHPNRMDFDVTSLSAADSAAQILKSLEELITP